MVAVSHVVLPRLQCDGPWQLGPSQLHVPCNFKRLFHTRIALALPSIGPCTEGFCSLLLQAAWILHRRQYRMGKMDPSTFVLHR